MVTPKPSNLKRFSALVEPLDWWTWTGLILSCFAVGVILSIEEGFKIKLSHFWTVISVVLYQSNSALAEFRSYASRLFWGGCFLFLTLFLGIFYQGELSSSITTLLPPIVPTTLAQLSDSELHLITKEGFIKIGQPVQSRFLRVCDDYLKSGTSRNQTRAALLENIRNNTKWVYLATTLIANNIAKNLPIYDVGGEQLDLGKDRTLAFLGHGDNIALFDIQSPMLLRKNFLQPILSRTFRQLVNSGLLGKWKQLEFEGVITFRINATFKNKSDSYILGKQFANSKFSKANSNISSVTLESVKYFCFVFVFLLALALAVQVMETFSYKFRLTRCK